MASAYVAISVDNHKKMTPILTAIRQVLEFYNINPIIFVERYSMSSADHAAMMQLALLNVDLADFLIAEVSEKAIGVGVEVGYAAAKGKPIVYLRKHDAPFSTTVGGIASHTIVYETETELRTKLSHTLQQLIRDKVHP
jgi:nucleoside 2-deoxyribosyltransferase